MTSFWLLHSVDRYFAQKRSLRRRRPSRFNLRGTPTGREPPCRFGRSLARRRASDLDHSLAASGRVIDDLLHLTSAHRRPTTSFPLPTPTRPSTTFEFRRMAVFGEATSPDSHRRSSTKARWRTVNPAAAAAALLNFFAVGRPQREVWEGGAECERPRRHPRLRHRRRPRRLCLSSV